MNIDNEPNTLAGHNVQVGDVVQYNRCSLIGNNLTIGCIKPFMADNIILDDEGHFWTVISRANPKPEIETQFGDWEWFKGNVPSGLVQPWYRDKNQAQAEMAETYDTSMLDWDFHKTSVSRIIAYRRVIGPVRGEVVITGADFGDGFLFAVGGRYGVDTHCITLPTTDGKLVTGRYTGPDGAVVTVGVLG